MKKRSKKKLKEHSKINMKIYKDKETIEEDTESEEEEVDNKFIITAEIKRKRKN